MAIQTTITNKAKIVTEKMEGRSSVAIGIWFKVGGRYEKHAVSGISHFIEHLIFKGTQKRSARRIKEEIEGLGGVLNGFTSEDTTCFLVKIVKDSLPKALEVLSDMVQNPLFSVTDIERERTVILEEIKMYLDMPMHHAHDLINQLLWPNQPLGMFVAGDFDSVKRITTKDIKDFHELYYQPKNALIAVCGDITHEEVLRCAKKYFTSKRNKKQIRSCAKALIRQTRPRFHFLEKKTEQSHLVLGMHAMSRTDKRRYALTLLHIIMGANMSSRLYEEVREKRGLAYEIRSGLNFYEDAGAFTISIGVENAKVEKTISLIMKELKKVTTNGIKEIELKRAKRYYLNQLFFTFEDTLDHMLWLGDKALFFEEIPDKERIRENIMKATCDDLLQVAKQIFRNANLNLVAIGPLDEKRQKKIKSVTKI